MNKISLIITVKNEADSIEDLLHSIVFQIRKPDEVVIVDGESTDDTFNRIDSFIAENQSNISWKLFREKSNISRGRNKAIETASNNLIAITDAGCVLRTDWLEELEKCYQQHDENTVVAGFYEGLPQNSFQAAVVPYVLIMPDQVDEESFLPATRSMLLPKKIWKELNGFDETLTVSEDFAFAHKIVEKYGQETIVFCKEAIVGWRPRSNLHQFFKMIFKMAEGDIRAGIYRGRVKLLFGRYIGGLLILLAVIKNQSELGFLFLLLAAVTYLVWSIQKNKNYAGGGWFYLPVLQMVADVAVILGSSSGSIYSK